MPAGLLKESESGRKSAFEAVYFLQAFLAWGRSGKAPDVNIPSHVFF